MNIPASPHFDPLSLASAFNVAGQDLTDGLRTPDGVGELVGERVFLGMPFLLGQTGTKNVILLDPAQGQAGVTIAVDNRLATYVLFLHQVEDRITNYAPGLADFAVDGNELGDLVADYGLAYADGSEVKVPILRRFAIQQSRMGWGASAFAAKPALAPSVFSTVSEAQVLGQMSTVPYGTGETRVASGRERMREKLWIYALPNPHPDKPIRRIVCTPQKERALIYAITTTQLTEHPLRPGLRRKARLSLPPGTKLNKLGEFTDLAIDLGTVISARAHFAYDRERWLSSEPLVQPTPAEQEVIVEYAAHPQAKLYVATDAEQTIVYDLADVDRCGSGRSRTRPSPGQGAGGRAGDNAAGGRAYSLSWPPWRIFAPARQPPQGQSVLV